MSPARHPARHVVVMGVSGCGKTQVGEHLAAALGWGFVEGDQHHPPANIAKMSSGRPLDDKDRWPWLETLRELLRDDDRRGRSTVLPCSALKRSYRDVLRAGVPADRIYFVHLHGEFEVLLARMTRREHFMPPSLLRSQYDALEPLGPDEPGALVDVAATLDVVRREAERVVRGWLGRGG